MSKTIKASMLVEDFTLYPRNQVDDSHINDLVKAIKSGAELPPIIIDRSSKRIVDGFHRFRAFTKLFGPDTDIPAVLKDYASEAELYLDAVRYNAGHGRKLDRHDQTRIVLRLHELQVDDVTIASALHVPEPEVRTLAVRIVYDDGGTAMPQKRGLEHMRGQTLTAGQVAAMKSVRSAEVGRLCIELTKLLDQEMVDYTDPLIEERLRQVAHAVTLSLKRIRAMGKKQERETVVQ